MAWLKAILALPKILDSVVALVTILEKQFGPDWAAAIARINEAYRSLETAKTDAERDDALKNISGAWSGKPRAK